MKPIRSTLLVLVLVTLSANSPQQTRTQAQGSVRGGMVDGADPVFDRPAPITLAELAARRTQGVSAVEVNDYAPGHYTGPLAPSPPHADMNARKAVVVFWKDHPQRLIFSHEASYCPLLELTNGTACAINSLKATLEMPSYSTMGGARSGTVSRPGSVLTFGTC